MLGKQNGNTAKTIDSTTKCKAFFQVCFDLVSTAGGNTVAYTQVRRVDSGPLSWPWPNMLPSKLHDANQYPKLLYSRQSVR